MSAIGPTSSLHFNWLPQPSAWQQTQKMDAEMSTAISGSGSSSVDSVLTDSVGSSDDGITSALATNLASAEINQFQTEGTLAAQAALNRVQAAAKAKQDQQQAAAPAATTPANPSSVKLSDGTVVNVDPSTTLEGGARINPTDGILTLPDGTQINTKFNTPVLPSTDDSTDTPPGTNVDITA